MANNYIDWALFLVSETSGKTEIIDFGDVDGESLYWDENEDRIAEEILLEGLTTPNQLPQEGLYLVALDNSDFGDEIHRLYWVHAHTGAGSRLVNWHPGMRTFNSQWQKSEITVRSSKSPL